MEKARIEYCGFHDASCMTHAHGDASLAESTQVYNRANGCMSVV